VTAAPSDTLRERAPVRSRWHLPRWPDPWRPAVAVGAVAVGGLVAFLAPLGGVDLSRLNGRGLISVLPVISLLGITAAVVAFCAGLCLPRAYPAMLGATLVGIVICLDAVTVFTEPEPRFATAYQIAGFVEYVSRTGHTAPGLDAYFSWPSFFGAVAFLQRVTGNHDLIPVLRWWPVIIDMACLVPLYLIMRNLRASWRAKWFAAFLFEVGNWVGQDYFSPQSFNYLLYLAFVAILLTWFGLRPRAATPVPEAKPETGHGIVSWLRSWYSMLVPGEMESRPSSPAQRAVLLAILLGIFVVSTTSHQLTPFEMIAACLGLVAVRRCTITGLPVLLAVIVIGWVSFAAVAFWSGHLSALFGDLGNLTGNVTSSVTGRMTGTSQHLYVLEVRSASAAAFLLMAAGGLLRRRRRVTDDRVLIALMCMPFLGFATQSYGGEIALRVYLFALPAAALLAAYLFFPATRDEGGGRPWRAFLPVAACAVTLVFAFLVARYGNEAFEQTPPGEVAAFDYLYAHDQDGVRLLWLSPDPAVDDTPEMPWEYRDIEKINFIPELAPRDPGSLAGLVATLRAAGPGSYLITTTTQETYLNQEASYPVGWGAEFRAQMAATPGVRTVFANADAVIYTLQWPRGTPVRPLGLANASTVSQSTLWTPAGLVVLGLLLLVLTAREFIRVCLGAPRRLIRALTLASLPLLVVFIGVVIIRFIVIA
jgi:hypothetical protein